MDRPGLVGPPPSRPFDRPLRAMQLHDRMQSAGKLTICPPESKEGRERRHFCASQATDTSL